MDKSYRFINSNNLSNRHIPGSQVRKRLKSGMDTKLDNFSQNEQNESAGILDDQKSVSGELSSDVLSQSQEMVEERSPQKVVEESLKSLKEMGAAYTKSIKSEEVDGENDAYVITTAEESVDISYPETADKVVPVVESSYILFCQVLFPFFVAGVGMVLAGLVLDIVQHWDLFVQVPETFILVPALLGLKGNLEMTLASRMSTLANMGKLDSRGSRWIVIVSNLALVQVQAIVVAFLASSFAIILAWIPKGQIDWSHAALLCASSLTTASVASFILSLVMIAVILVSRCLRINPDNVATPIAASLGDLTTLGVLSLLGSRFLHAHLTQSWLNVVAIACFLLAAPAWAHLVRRDEGAADVLENGWSPIIFSMLISSTGGFILEGAIKKFPKIAVFQPAINGVGGNLAAVQASRLATYYHRTAIAADEIDLSKFLSFRRAFFSSDWDSRSARVLLLLVCPCHLIFNWLIVIFHKGASPPSGPTFTSFYLFAALTQVILLLYVCQWLVAFMWSIQVDPDCASIPYLTALGDLSGTFLLFLIFVILSWMNVSQVL